MQDQNEIRTNGKNEMPLIPLLWMGGAIYAGYVVGRTDPDMDLLKKIVELIPSTITDGLPRTRDGEIVAHLIR